MNKNGNVVQNTCILFNKRVLLDLSVRDIERLLVILLLVFLR